MHVDVHRVRRERQGHEHEGFLRLWEYGRVDSLARALKRGAVHQPLIDEQDERAAFGVVTRGGHQGIHGEPGRRVVVVAGASASCVFFIVAGAAQRHRRQLAGRLRAVYGLQPVQPVLHDRAVQRRPRLAVFPARERHVRSHGGVPLDDVEHL